MFGYSELVGYGESTCSGGAWTSGGGPVRFFVDDETFIPGVFGGARVVGVVAVVLVDNRVHHYGLLVDCERGVCRYSYP